MFNIWGVCFSLMIFFIKINVELYNTQDDQPQCEDRFCRYEKYMHKLYYRRSLKNLNVFKKYYKCNEAKFSPCECVFLLVFAL